MAIIHCDVVFQKKNVPTLAAFKERLEARTGLGTRLSIDPLEKIDHEWPHIGRVRESGTLECDEADESDFEVTVGSAGVRLTFVARSINQYLRDSAIAALVDLGGKWDAKLSSLSGRTWAELSAAEKQLGTHG